MIGDSKYRQVLLASHGTRGAQAAVSLAMQICRRDAARLQHLVVVPEFWKDMMGDDWLNNGVSRDRFGRYVENELGREIDEHVDAVQALAKQEAIDYGHHIQLGEPTDRLLDLVRQQSFDIVVIGSQRPKNVPGVNSKLDLSRLSQELVLPLLIAPFPR